MRLRIRRLSDKLFTGLTLSSVIFLTLLLLIVLGPMIIRGTGAIFFKGTIEFRKMQLALFNRGDADKIKAETAETEKVRLYIYETITKFKQGVDIASLQEKNKQIYRQFGKELRYNDVENEQYGELRTLARDIRDKLDTAFETTDKNQQQQCIEYVLNYRDHEGFKKTTAADFFTLADDFYNLAKSIDLTKRQEFSKSIEIIDELIPQLFGPKPGDSMPALIQFRYGATRWDMAEKVLDRLIWEEKWVEKEPGKPLVKTRNKRADEFAGTALEPLFKYLEENAPAMLNPKPTFYWQYFIDDSTPGHYFGGVGPEIYGTLLITIISMLMAVPLGIISAAYLVECASDNIVIRPIRMCINTLAGVPSIVFGLFGLAFFVLYLFPLIGLQPKACILAASMTLALLTLPVIIRASEEAIRSVPLSYKEASLALGAGGLRTFLTVTFPVALPGILTGIILGISRVAGETAPILFTGAVAFGSIPKSILGTTRTLSYGIYDIAVGDRLSMLVPHNQYGMVLTLVLLIICLNTTAIVLRGRIFKKLKGH